MDYNKDYECVSIKSIPGFLDKGAKLVYVNLGYPDECIALIQIYNEDITDQFVIGKVYRINITERLKEEK